MNKSVAATAVIIGIVLSGQCAVWGACLGGHNPEAGYPFPDFKGIVLFLIGVTVVPLGVAVITTIIRSVIATYHTSVRIPISIAILLLGPLFSLAMGYSMQSRDNHARDKNNAFYAQQKEAYFNLAAQLTADPGIVLRERWFDPSPVPWSAAVSARQMVFEDSFQPKHLTVAYTGDQLREIAELSHDKRLFVVCHPKCPPDLIESMWPLVLSSGQAWLIEQMIDNSATPRHLFEEYQSDRLHSNRAVSGWIDRAIEERLKIPKSSHRMPDQPHSSNSNHSPAAGHRWI